MQNKKCLHKLSDKITFYMHAKNDFIDGTTAKKHVDSGVDVPRHFAEFVKFWARENNYSVIPADLKNIAFCATELDSNKSIDLARVHDYFEAYWILLQLTIFDRPQKYAYFTLVFRKLGVFFSHIEYFTTREPTTAYILKDGKKIPFMCF